MRPGTPDQSQNSDNLPNDTDSESAPIITSTVPVQNAPSTDESSQVIGQQQTTTPSVNATNQQIGSSLGGPIPSKKRGKIVKLFLIALIALILLGGGSAGAYFGYVVPNKPENKLQKALFNSLSKQELSSKGDMTFDYSDEASPIKSMKLSFDTQFDGAASSISGDFELSISGVKIPISVRMVDKNFYIKIGDLTSLLAALQLSDASVEYGDIFSLLTEEIADKWIEIDDTLIKQVGLNPDDCVFGTSLSSEDLKKLEEAYSKNRFFTIQSTSSEAVDGATSTKFVLNANEAKAKEFEKSLKDLTITKQLEKCSQPDDTQSNGADQEVKDENPLMNYEMAVWVDSGTNLINKFEFKAKDKDVQGSISAKISYKAVDITKPEGAIPALTLFNKLQQSFLSTYGAELPTDVQGWSTLIPSPLISD